jgi:hypothetical protein
MAKRRPSHGIAYALIVAGVLIGVVLGIGGYTFITS